MAEQVYFEDVNEGDEIPPLVKNCSTQQLVMWAAASGDFYQIHYDEGFARGNNLPGIIVHGALKGAFLGQMLDDWVGEKGRIKRFGCQYRGMDFPYQDIICRGVIKRKYVEDGQHLVDLEIWTETGEARDPNRPRNEPGQRTSPGSATVILPSRGS